MRPVGAPKSTRGEIGASGFERGAGYRPTSYEITESGRIMYAIIETGGKQYRVTPGDVIEVYELEKVARRIAAGDQASRSHAADRASA